MVGLESVAVEPWADEIAAGDVADDDDDAVDAMIAVNDDGFDRDRRANGSGHLHREHGS